MGLIYEKNLGQKSHDTAPLICYDNLNTTFVCRSKTDIILVLDMHAYYRLRVSHAAFCMCV